MRNSQTLHFFVPSHSALFTPVNTPPTATLPLSLLLLLPPQVLASLGLAWAHLAFMVGAGERAASHCAEGVGVFRVVGPLRCLLHGLHQAADEEVVLQG